MTRNHTSIYAMERKGRTNNSRFVGPYDAVCNMLHSLIKKNPYMYNVRIGKGSQRKSIQFSSHEAVSQVLLKREKDVEDRIRHGSNSTVEEFQFMAKQLWCYIKAVLICLHFVRLSLSRTLNQ